jgi:hypothetical protein
MGKQPNSKPEEKGDQIDITVGDNAQNAAAGKGVTQIVGDGNVVGEGSMSHVNKTETHFHAPVTGPVHSGSGDIHVQSGEDQPPSPPSSSEVTSTRRPRWGWIAFSVVVAAISGIAANIIATKLQEQFDLLSNPGRFAIVVVVFVITLAIGVWLAVKQGHKPS